MQAFARHFAGLLAGVISCAMGAAVPASGQNTSDDPVESFPDIAFVCPDGRFQSGCQMEDIDAAIVLNHAGPQDFAERCLYESEADCQVTASGRINRLTDAPSLHWQLLDLQPVDGPRAKMLVLADYDGTALDLLFARQVDGYFDAPTAVDAGEDAGNRRFILHIPALNRSLGNADIVVFTSGEGWNWTDAAALMGQADTLLPPGFSTASPVNFNFHEMTAFAPVRRDDDAGCCSTGGVAVLDFGQSAHSLAVSAVTFTETRPVGEARTALSGDDE